MTQQFSTSSSDSNVEGFELSPQQARLWHLQQSERGALSDARLCLRLPEGVNVERLKASLNSLVERHEILRTRYHQLPGMRLPVQVIEEQVDLGAHLNFAQDGHVALHLPAAHIDSASLLQLAEQWASAYLGDEAGDPPLQYADYAAWRQELIGSQAEAQAYWEAQFAALTPPTFLPLRKKATAGDVVDIAETSLSIPADLRQQWCALAENLEVSPSMVALGTWTVLLQQHSDCEQLTLALDWQHRTPDLADALGLFSEPLPLTLDELDTASFTAFCQRLQQKAAELVEWRDYFPSQGASGDFGSINSAGFRIMDGSDSNSSAGALAGAGWQILQADSPTAPCHLLLEHRTEVSGGGELILRYNRNLYGRLAIAQVQEQLLNLLQDICQNPERPFCNFSALSSKDHNDLAGTVSSMSHLTDKQEQLYQRMVSRPHLASCFAENMHECADAPAVKGVSGCLTYQMLDQQATQLAARLADTGVVIGTRVGHFLPRDIDAIAAMLAVFKLGAVYVPIDPNYPESRITYILSDSRAECVITREALVPALPDAWRNSERVILTDPSTNEVTAPTKKIVLEAAEVAHGDLAYIIYTSGSTGEPKGVAITHGNALHSLAARIAYYPEPVRHFLMLSSFAFDSSVAGLFWTLAQGGCLHLADEAEQKNPAQLAEIISRERISHLLALPSLYQLLLQELADDRCVLTTSIVAGEACPRALVNAHYEKLSLARLYNEYGPTEASVWSTVSECRPEALEVPVPIGRAIPHSQVALLNEAREPLARGLKGEIYIGGAGLSPGYLNRPELTAEKFILHQGERFYRSGDYAYTDEYGEIVFLGRADAQVKIRGYRIELGEIEAALLRAAQVQQVAVVVATAQDGQSQLRAFIESERGLDIELIRRELNTRLPAFMVPTDIQLLKQFPRSANGKTDKKALLALKPRQRRAPYRAPATPTQKALASLWQNLLDVEQAGLDDDFFALGGHSLLVVRLIHEIKAQLHAEVPVADVFQYSTLGALADTIGQHTERADMVVLKEGESSSTPLFCLHQPSGEVHHYQPLVQSLPASQKVYGIALPKGRTSDNTSLMQLAEGYCLEIKKLQPQGPYFLCGWSMGGLLALAVADELERSGEEVAFLATIDSTFKDNDDSLTFEQLQALYLDELTEESWRRFVAQPEEKLAQLKAHLQGLGKYEQLCYLLQVWTPNRSLELKAAPEVVDFALETMRHARQWVRQFHAPVLETDVHSWWATDTLQQDDQVMAAWAKLYSDRLYHHTVPADHDNILREPLFLNQFRLRLAEAQTTAETIA